MRNRWTLLAVPAALLAGVMIAEAVRTATHGGDEVLVRRQAERIAELEHEVEALHVALDARPPLPAEAHEPLLRGASPTNLPMAVAVTEPARGSDPAVPWSASAPDPETPVLDLVRMLGKHGARQTSTVLVDDIDVFAGRFARAEEGPVVRAEETNPDADVRDGTTILLDDGVYDFSAFSSAHRGRFPADVTFRGIGMDRTLLVLHEIGATGETRNLAFEDLTLDTRGHYLADVRGDEPISLRFERARVIGFDQRPGGAVLLAARHGAVLGKEARFEAGFGNAPGAGSLFHVRGPFLVRFERCAFVGAFRSLYEKSDRAAYAYVRCRFEHMSPESRPWFETRDENVRFEDCFVAYEDPGPDGLEARDRSDLNPAWR